MAKPSYYVGGRINVSQRHETEGSSQSFTLEGKKAWRGCKRSACWMQGVGCPILSTYMCNVSLYVYEIYVHFIYIYIHTYIEREIIFLNDPLRSLKEQLARPSLSPRGSEQAFSKCVTLACGLF